jgi:hypothetical protein
MRKIFYLLLFSFLVGGCATGSSTEHITTPSLINDYIAEHIIEIDAYNTKYRSELNDLANKITDECVVKKINSKKSISLEKLINIILNCRVIYKIDDKGVIESAWYDGHNRSQAQCVNKNAVGYPLPEPKGVKYIYDQFRVEVTGDKI